MGSTVNHLTWHKSDSTDLFSGDSWQLSFSQAKFAIWGFEPVKWYRLLGGLSLLNGFAGFPWNRHPRTWMVTTWFFGCQERAKCNSGTPSITVSLLIYQHDGQYLKASPTFFMFAFRKWMFRGFRVSTDACHSGTSQKASFCDGSLELWMT